MVLARAARPFGQVVLEVRVSRSDLHHALDRGGREWGASEVRVHDDPGRIEDAAQPGPARQRELREGTLDEVTGRRATGRDLRARTLEGAPRSGKSRRPWLPCQPLVAEQ